MALKQLSVFVENSRGSMYRITSVLAEKGIDIRALSVADTQNYGILRLIVSDVTLAKQVLTDIGCLVQETDVVCVRIDDNPGQLAATLGVLADASIDLSYLYAFLTPNNGQAYVVIRVENIVTAEEVLTKAGFPVISK